MIIPCEMQTEICLPTKTRSFSYPPSCSDTSKCWLVIVLYEHCPLFLWNNCYQLYFTKCKIIYKAERVGKSNRNQKKINIALWTCVLLNSSFTLKDYIITLSHMCVFFFSLIYISEAGQALIALLRRMTSIIQKVLIIAYFINSMLKKKKQL